MTYFKNLVETAEAKTVRGAQIERLTLKGKFPDALKTFTQVGQSILRDMGITKFKLKDSGQAKDRNYAVVYELVFNIHDGEVDRNIDNVAKSFLGDDVHFNSYIKDNEVAMYLRVPIDEK